MSDLLEQLAIACVAEGVAVDLTAAADTETVLYTVPSGYQFIPLMAVMRGWSEDPGAAVVTLGKAGGNCDEFLGNQTLSNITASFADQAAILQPIPSATPAASVILDAVEQLAIEITTQGTGNCKVDVFGRLIAV
ncbi:MAG: hypothetical protein LLF76_02960 [Planctomycetaceae bacterium]|nr:hypothetical protein [Planctomycetaceae bacterium]